jgi:hypothetical protein
VGGGCSGGGCSGGIKGSPLFIGIKHEGFGAGEMYVGKSEREMYKCPKTNQLQTVT